MIIDSLTNIGKYVALNPLFQDVVDYIRNNDLASKPEGKDVIKGDDLFANFVVTKGKTKEEAKLETHDKMIDIVVDYELDLAVTLSVVPIDLSQYLEWKSTLPFYKNIEKEGILLWKAA